MSALDVAIGRFDLADYVLQKGAEEVQPGEWVLTCPTCQKDKLTVNLAKKTWHCWVCQRFESHFHSIRGVVNRPVAGAGGLLDLIQLLDGISREAAASKIMASSRVQVSELDALPEMELVRDLVGDIREPVTVAPPDFARPIDGILPYMERRGITIADVRGFGLFYCDGGRYADRIIFPVYERDRLVYFQARAMWEPRPGERYVKALNPLRVDGAAVSSEVLMNLNRAAAYPRVVITEGPMDCIRAGADAVCTFGKRITYAQIAKLIRAGVRAVDLMWDADARQDMMQAAPLLGSLFDLRIVYLPYGDPADFSRQELQTMRQKSAQRPVDAYTGLDAI